MNGLLSDSVAWEECNPQTTKKVKPRIAGLNLAVSLQKVRAFLDGKSTKTVVVETTKKR
jgi:hypothetical protein